MDQLLDLGNQLFAVDTKLFRAEFSYGVLIILLYRVSVLSHNFAQM